MRSIDDIGRLGERTSHVTRIALCLSISLVASTVSAQQVAATLTGVASVQDGDGILFGQVEVRLKGIAAPELREPMGRESYIGLLSLVDGQEVRCELDGTVANRRPVGTCFIDGRDIGMAQVRAGLARDCATYSKGRYRKAEERARSEGKDLSQSYALPGYC